jgi:hypothetical protein
MATFCPRKRPAIMPTNGAAHSMAAMKTMAVVRNMVATRMVNSIATSSVSRT